MEENNKLIAKFMGVVFHDDENQYYDNNGLYIGEDLQYHSSWDWLMPVIKKIKLMDVNLKTWRMITNPSDYEIENVHNQVVEFIKEYNDKKSNNG